MDNNDAINNERQPQQPTAAQGQAAPSGTPAEPRQPLHFESRIDLSGLQVAADKIRSEVSKIIVGQVDMVEMILVGLLANGHILLEGVPGVAKTLSAKLLARTLDVGYSRIQFTPDLMPSDVLGTTIYNNTRSEFEFRKGPIFSNIVLIDEINRAPAKTQAALFEVMEERQITIDGVQYPLAPPFIVLATQNPIEQEGTYRLPEAQLDRFLFKINVGYPSQEEEVKLLGMEHTKTATDKLEEVAKVLGAAEIARYQALVAQVRVEPQIITYIAAITHNTRNNGFLFLGASPRASIAMLRASKAMAALQGRDFVTPEDVQSVAPPILRHRIMVTPEREMEGISTDQIVQQILQSIEIPR